MSMHIIRSGIVPLIFVGLTAAVGAQAQTGPLARSEAFALPAPALVDNVAADSFARAAERLYASPAEATRAARLQLQSASLRAAGSTERVESLRLAARLSGYAGDWRQARATLEVLADEQLAFGDVVAAANSTVDAAFMAVHEGNSRAVQHLTERARWLAALPAVGAAERSEILRRIDGRP